MWRRRGLFSDLENSNELTEVNIEIWKPLISILQHTDTCNHPQLHVQTPYKNIRREDV
jgi:hypothetical protein